MYLTRFGVKNYKCLGDIDISLTPIHVLIGENDSGKTSLLDAIEIFTGSANEQLTNLLPSSCEKTELVCYRSQHPSFQLEGELVAPAFKNIGKKKIWYGFLIDCPEKNTCQVSEEWIGANLLNKKTFQSPYPQMTSIFALKHNVGPISNKDRTVFNDNEENLKTISNILKPAQAYSFKAKELATPASLNVQNIDQKFQIDRNGFGLATLLDDLLGYDAKAYVHLCEEYYRFFPQYKNIRIEKQKTPQGIGKGIVFETCSGNAIRASMVSDGALLLLGFLALTFIPMPPPLILIEEPENGIYPKRLGEVIKLLKKLAKGNESVNFPQIILTTHSPYVLSFFDPEEVTFLSRPPGDPDGPVRARQLSQAPNINERLAGGDFYLGELWYNLSEEDLFGVQ